MVGGHTVLDHIHETPPTRWLQATAYDSRLTGEMKNDTTSTNTDLGLMTE